MSEGTEAAEADDDNMARIRTIKPEFFRHYDLWKIEKDTSLPVRVAYTGLWTVADREGRFRWRPQELKVLILPYDEVDFDELLDALHVGGFISKYQIGEDLYGVIPTWKNHQVINIREAQSKIPAPEKDSFLETPTERTCTHMRAPAKYVCVNCGCSAGILFYPIVPFENGGTHDVSNLLLLCRDCENRRGINAVEAVPETHVHAHADTCTHVGKGKELKKDAAPSARNGFDVPQTEDAALFERGEKVLGTGSRGLVAKLKKANGGNVALTRAAVEVASTKLKPREYVGGIIRGNKDGKEDGTSGLCTIPLEG